MLPSGFLYRFLVSASPNISMVLGLVVVVRRSAATRCEELTVFNAPPSPAIIILPEA